MIQCEHGYHHGVGDVHACDPINHNGECVAWALENLAARGYGKGRAAKEAIMRALDNGEPI